MQQVLHDIKMVVIVILLIFFCIIMIAFLSFVVSSYTGMGYIYRPPEVNGALLAYNHIDTHDYNNPNVYIRS